MGERVERRLAAILAADVVGYSRLMGADEEGTLARLKAHRRELIDPKIREHRGRIVKTTGDGALVEFSSVVDAVRCAAEIQRGMRDRETGEAEDRRIRFRIGVNLGDIIAEEGDIFGDGVNVAARLEALSEPGGLCISGSAREQIGNRLPYGFEDLGEQSVKNIARPVRAFALSADAVAALPPVAVAAVAPTAIPLRRRGDLRLYLAAIGAAILIALAGGWWAWSLRGERAAAPAVAGQTKPAPPLSIVVLPFENLSNDPGQDYFADAVTDDLTTDLSRIKGSFVIARTTAFTYKGKAVDVRKIGRELGVRYVLEGSVRRSGDRVHANVQLIDAASGAHVWADQFDTDRRDLAKAESEITGRLARGLGWELLREAGRRVALERTVDPDAQDLVMRAWELYQFRISFVAANKREALKRTIIGLLERALALDPQSVDARVQLALVLAGDILQGFSKSPKQDLARAERLISEALERDPDNSMAHGVMGRIRGLQHRWAEERAEFETAVALDPNNAWAIMSLGFNRLRLGKPEAAIPYLEEAIRLDARSPNLAYYYSFLARAYLFKGRSDEAVTLLRKAEALAPRLWYVHIQLAGALGFRGDIDEAKKEIAQSLKLNPKVNSIARLRAGLLATGMSPQYVALSEKTSFVGLRRAGFPEK